MNAFAGWPQRFGTTTRDAGGFSLVRVIASGLLLLVILMLLGFSALAGVLHAYGRPTAHTSHSHRT
jgi:hypothetical protein